MHYDMKQSGLRIQQLRIQHGYTQEEFAKMLNIGRSNLSRIESGRRGCSLELLVQISSLFGVSLNYLVLGQEMPDTLAINEREHLKGTVEALIKQLETFKAAL